MRLLVPGSYRSRLPESLAGHTIDWYDDYEQCQGLIAGAEALWLDFWQPEQIRAVCENGEKLGWLFTPEVGLDKYPMSLLGRRGVMVTNGRGLYDVPIAEHTLLLMLAAARHLPEMVRRADAHRWRPAPAPTELAGSHALIVGLGSIGTAIAHRLRCLGVTVTGTRSRPDPSTGVLGPSQWRDEIAHADWLILALPLTGSTSGLIGTTELERMKPTAWLVNVGRGRLVDTSALVAALAAGRLGGAALDVTDPEPLPLDHPLWQADNVIITPHASWLSPASAQRVAQRFLENLGRFGNGLPLLGHVARSLDDPPTGQDTL